MTKTTSRTVEVVSADGIAFRILFERTADRCWHLVVTETVASGFRSGPFDKLIHQRDGLVRIEATSLEGLMSFLAEHIGRTEF